MATRLTLTPPEDYVLHRDVCSYGYFLLAPNRWVPSTKTLSRPLTLSDGEVVDVNIQQEECAGGALTVRSKTTIPREEHTEVREQIQRMLWLSDDDVKNFHKVDPRWKSSGRGRFFRSPTFFEDVVKTVTSCNIRWSGTMTMNSRLCEVFGPGFPSARRLARAKPATLRSRCRVGYRDKRLIELAKLVVRGEVEESRYADPERPDDEVFKVLQGLPGVGPYAAANIMQLLGRFKRLPIDTEAMRHAREVLGLKGSEASLRKQLEQHYRPFGEHRFRSYWFELWTRYEGRHGPAWTWEASASGRVLTGS